MKNIKHTYSLVAPLAAIFVLLIVSCSRDEEDLELATFPTTAEVFIDAFAGGSDYAAFGTSKLTAFEVVSDVRYKGTASMRFEIPNEGDPAGTFAGGIIVGGARDLSGYNALTFWAKSSQAATVDKIGFGTDFEEDRFPTALNNIRMGTAWTQYTIPIPDASKLTQEKGFFEFADGPEDGDGYTVWIDEVRFENLTTIGQPRSAMLNGEDVSEQSFVGVSRQINGLTFTVNLPSGADPSLMPEIELLPLLP